MGALANLIFTSTADLMFVTFTVRTLEPRTLDIFVYIVFFDDEEVKALLVMYSVYMYSIL